MSDNAKPCESPDTSWMDEMPEAKLTPWMLMAATFPAVAPSPATSAETFSLSANHANSPAASHEATPGNTQVPATTRSNGSNP